MDARKGGKDRLKIKIDFTDEPKKIPLRELEQQQDKSQVKFEDRYIMGKLLGTLLYFVSVSQKAKEHMQS